MPSPLLRLPGPRTRDGARGCDAAAVKLPFVVSKRSRLVKITAGRFVQRHVDYGIDRCAIVRVVVDWPCLCADLWVLKRHGSDIGFLDDASPVAVLGTRSLSTL